MANEQKRSLAFHERAEQTTSLELTSRWDKAKTSLSETFI